MRITESRIRRIIREEARRVLREGMDDEMGGGGFNAFLTIHNVSEITDAMDMSPEDLVTMLEDIVHRDFRGQVELTGEDGGGHVPDGPPYSPEYDAIGAMGTRRALERFIRVVENEIHGPAQSIEDGEGLEYDIQDF